jgi:hypothetical protein
MANISFKINLRLLKHYITTSKKGNKVIVIGIKENNLFEGEKGIYMDMQAYELREKREDSKDTHIIKQSLPKAVFDKMTKEEKEAMPILDNAIYWGNVHQEPEPNGAVVSIDTVFGGTPEENDDLPF